MIKKSVCLPEELNHELAQMVNQSKFIRRAVQKALSKRVFRVTLECRSIGNSFITNSYVTVKARQFDGDLKEQIQAHLETLNKLETRKNCRWSFDCLTERTKEA